MPVAANHEGADVAPHIGARALHQAPFALRLGVRAEHGPSTAARKFAPLANRLAAALTTRLGETLSVRLEPSRSYHAGIDELVEGRVDFARFGPASYVAAEQRAPGVRVLAVESVAGQKQFNGLIVVNRRSPVRSVADLRGRVFAFGDPLSTTGRYLPQAHLVMHGLRAADLGGYAYLGHHDAVGFAIAAGEFDAGAINEDTYRKLAGAGIPLCAIAEFQNVTRPWLARPGLDPGVSAALSAALLDMREPDVLRALRTGRFLPGSRADYEAVRRAIDLNREFFR